MDEQKLTIIQRAMFVLATTKDFDNDSLADRVEAAFPDLTHIERKMIYDESGRARDVMGLAALKASRTEG